MCDTNGWKKFKEWLPGARIAAVHIRNFRGIVDLKITDWDKRGTLFLIGPNGSGKSTVLYALRWLFGDNSFVDSDNCKLVSLAESDAAIEVKGSIEGSRYGKFFSWVEEEPGRVEENSPEVAVLFTKDKPEDKDVMDEARALHRGESWCFCQFDVEKNRIGAAGKPQEINSAPKDIRIHVLSLSPTEASVRDAPHEVRKVMVEYFKSIFIKNPDDNAEVSISEIEYKKGKFDDKYSDLQSDTEDLLSAFEAAIEEISYNLGSQLYESRLGLRESADEALKGYFLKEKKGEIKKILEGILGDIGVFTINLKEKTAGRPTNDFHEKGHSAGTLQSLALLNLYGWLEAMNSYYNSNVEGDKKQKSSVPLFLLLLEEPEVFLHPQWARVFSDTLSDLGKDSKMPVQAMVTTHSPIFARVDRHKQLQIHHVVHDADRRYRVYAYSGENTSKTHIKKRLNHIAQFHPTINELFFAKRVALVEGPTEMWVFPTLARWLWNSEWGTNKQSSKGPDPTYNTTLVPCGPDNMKDLVEILSRLGVKPIVVHDFDPLKKKGKGNSKSSIIGRNRNIEVAIRDFGGNSKNQLRRLNPDLEGVMGYGAYNKYKQYNALIFLTWLFKGYWGETNKEGTNCGNCVKKEGLLDLIADWEDESKEVRSKEYNNPPFSPLVTRGTCGVPTVGSNFLYLLDVITEIYTPPGDERIRKTWQRRKKEFIHYLRRRGILTVSGQIIKPDKISVRKEKKEKKCL